MSKDLFSIIFIYVIISISGLLSWLFVPVDGEILRFFIADLVMTVVCFTFSLIKKNTSVYDAYWSVIPFLFIVAWSVLHAESINVYHAIVFGIVSLWSWRLSHNWARSWDGFAHEDWRYIDMAKQTGKMYPLVNFLALHLFPTLIVFAGMLPLFFTLRQSLNSTILFAIGCLIALTGIGFEFFADNELFRFRQRENKKQGEILAAGLWGMCRYPNYLGEILFWLGLAVVGQAYLAPLYTIIGSIAMFILIRFASIPMKEKRMMERRDNYSDYQQQTGLLIPKFWK